MSRWLALIAISCIGSSDVSSETRAPGALGSSASAQLEVAPDGAATANIGPGGLCPLGTGCADGLGCWYAPAVDGFYCTVPCQSDGDCVRVGFTAGCCVSLTGVQGPIPVCMSTSLGFCGNPDGGR